MRACWMILGVVSACSSRRAEPVRGEAVSASRASATGGAASGASVPSAVVAASGSVAAAAAVAPVASAPRPVGPYEEPFLEKRPVFYVTPAAGVVRPRLVANLHGMCNPPGYACGHWVTAASEVGFLVCPTGNARCGAEAGNAPTWSEPFEKISEDLERAIGVVEGRFPGEVGREGAVLTGFSLGATAAWRIAEAHPGRWPYLILNEAVVATSAERLRKAGVRAVALFAGERGSQLAGQRRLLATLTREGFPARLWVMPGAGHHYSADIDQLMREALAWVVSAG